MLALSDKKHKKHPEPNSVREENNTHQILNDRLHPQ